MVVVGGGGARVGGRRMRVGVGRSRRASAWLVAGRVRVAGQFRALGRGCLGWETVSPAGGSVELLGSGHTRAEDLLLLPLKVASVDPDWVRPPVRRDNRGVAAVADLV